MSRKGNWREKHDARREAHWDATVKIWIEARNELPQELMEALGNFQTEFLELAMKHNISPPHVIVALSHLFGPVIAEHHARQPDNLEAHEWHESIYAAIRDAIVVAHALFCAVQDGTIIADEETRTLRGRLIN